MFAISGEGDQASGNFPIVKNRSRCHSESHRRRGISRCSCDVRPKGDSSPSARLGM